jgi:hypothetical protein
VTSVALSLNEAQRAMNWKVLAITSIKKPKG